MFMQLILTNTAKAFAVTSHNDRNFIIFRGVTTKAFKVVLISSIVLIKKFQNNNSLNFLYINYN